MAAVVFAPWAFGTTQPWSVHSMNVLGYAVGMLTLTEVFILRANRANRGAAGPPKPGEEPRSASAGRESNATAPRASTSVTLNQPVATATGESKGNARRCLGRALLVVSGLVLVYIAVSVWNAAATYDDVTQTFTDRLYSKTMPHTFNRGKTLQYLFNYAALACFFWATVQWLRTDPSISGRGGVATFVLAPRFRRLLWVVSINGALIALEGILQRALNSSKLLFLVQPRVNPGAEAQFGPYAYRSNAAQYLNLIWPVTVGFWLSLHRAQEHGLRIAARRGPPLHNTLIVCALAMAVAPLVCTSRAGALITVASAVAVMAVIWFAFRGESVLTRWGIPVLLLIALAFGYQLGWKALSPRLETIGQDYVSREKIYDTGRKIASDYPLFGTGAGSLDSLYQLYRESPDDYWPVQLHNDWLETLVTFGWLGSSLIAIAVLLVLLRWFVPGQVRAGKYFVLCVWIAFAGCMVHARWDFPFQIYSIVHLFLTLCALLFCLARKTLHGRA